MSNIARHLPEAPSQEWEPHFILTLGPPIRPGREVPTGKRIQRSARVWVDIDLLLTASTITEAWELSRGRRPEA